jgi:C-terminal processing protease CtpA/Prc
VIGRRAWLALALAAPLGLLAASEAAGLLDDFDAAWRAIDTRYAYMDRSRPAWRRARETWRPRAMRARSPRELAEVLEGAIAELRDDHVSLAERTPGAPRRVPAETDIWAAWRDGAARVEAVRTFGDADVAGLRPGNVVERIAGVPAGRAVREALGAGSADARARDWALRHVLAGPREGVLALEVREGAATRSLEIERQRAPAGNGPPLIGRRMGEERDLGYIRIKHAAQDPRFVEHFDGALNYLRDTRALILDLREVTDGTREMTHAILGRFAAAQAPWQLRERGPGRRVADVVAPRGERYRAPVLVLVDRWTAGEGEAVAAGMVAVANARLVGTAMAGLRGELGEVRLAASGLVLRFPVDKVFHVDGTPREALRPHVLVDLAAPQGGPGDPILYQALKLLEKR